MWESRGRKGEKGSERAHCARKKGPIAGWEKGLLKPWDNSPFPRQNLPFKPCPGIDGAEDWDFFFFRSAGRKPAPVIAGI